MTIKKMDNRKAQSHVEMIFSFIIFVGFLFFIFYIANPFAETKQPDYVMENLQAAITENISSEVGELSIILNTIGTCYDFSSLEYPGNYIEIRDSADSRKYTIYFSNIFTTNIAPEKLATCTSNNYTLGLYSKESFIVYEKIKSLKESYEESENSYEALKATLKTGSDFSFKVQDLSGNAIPELSVEKQPPKNIDVESKEFPIITINSTAGINKYMINLRVWN